MENFIKSRNYLLKSDEILKIIDYSENPQITEVKFNAGNNTYFVTTNDNYQFYFTALPYNNNDKKLVRKPN